MEKNTKDTAKQILTEYLQSNGYRKTPERYAMLDAAYSIKGEFDLLTLCEYMETEARFRVCLATLYNNITLLVNAGIVSQRQSISRAKFKWALDEEETNNNLNLINRNNHEWRSI